MMNPSDSLKDLESMLDSQQAQQQGDGQQQHCQEDEHKSSTVDAPESSVEEKAQPVPKSFPHTATDKPAIQHVAKQTDTDNSENVQLSEKERKKMAKEARRLAHQQAFQAAKEAGQVAAKPKLSKSQRRGQQLKKNTPKDSKVCGQAITEDKDATQVRLPQLRPDSLPPSESWNLFTHLPEYCEKSVSLLPGVQVHPSVVRVALQMRSGRTCGSNARCFAMLIALKQVIEDYETPAHSTLNRDLLSHLRIQMDFLNRCRAQSVSMLNAFASLSHVVSTLRPFVPDAAAKLQLKEHIERFILERIVVADEAIVASAQRKIEDGDVVLIFARVPVLEKLMIESHQAGKKFRVIVADARPKLEGEKTLRVLVEQGVKCSYVLINAVSYVMKEVTKVFLGAAAMLSNGALLSRCGAAVVASMAHISRVPVIVCCETCKFSDKAQLDAITVNELGDPDDLLSKQQMGSMDWRSVQTMRLLNLAYDLTPAEFVSMVITEIGCIPASAVPVALRELYRKHL